MMKLQFITEYFIHVLWYVLFLKHDIYLTVLQSAVSKSVEHMKVSLHLSGLFH